MRINDTLFEVELSDVLSELQSQLRANNISLLQHMKDGPDNIMVQCPYHKDGTEKKPSAGIRKSDGVFHCFTCGETHTLPEMISYCFGRYTDIMGSFGWEWLLKNFLVVSVENRSSIQLNFERSKTKHHVDYISDDELDSYRYYHPYMYQRRLNDSIIDLFDIGYDANSECITFPIRDETGKTLFIARRSVHTKFFNYPAGVVKPVYGLYELNQLDKFPDEVVICESMLDALTVWVYGKHAVALNGLGNNLQFEQLNKMPCRKFILATDNDDAGMKARERIRGNIKHKLITEYVLPAGKKDINELEIEEFNSLQELF